MYTIDHDWYVNPNHMKKKDEHIQPQRQQKLLQKSATHNLTEHSDDRKVMKEKLWNNQRYLTSKDRLSVTTSSLSYTN